MDKTKTLKEIISEIDGINFQMLFSTDLNESEFQETLNTILYDSYILGFKDEILKFQEYFTSIESMTNKNIWTWIESSLTLLTIINREKGNTSEEKECLEKIKHAFSVGKNDMIITENANARKRRLNGSLLDKERIEKAELVGDKELQYDYRLGYLKQLFFIKALGAGEELSEDFIEKETKETIKVLSNLYYKGNGTN